MARLSASNVAHCSSACPLRQHALVVRRHTVIAPVSLMPHHAHYSTMHAPLRPHAARFDNYFGRKIAVDASMHIYQFLVVVGRQACCGRARARSQTHASRSSQWLVAAHVWVAPLPGARWARGCAPCCRLLPHPRTPPPPLLALTGRPAADERDGRGDQPPPRHVLPHDAPAGGR